MTTTTNTAPALQSCSRPQLAASIMVELQDRCPDVADETLQAVANLAADLFERATMAGPNIGLVDDGVLVLGMLLTSLGYERIEGSRAANILTMTIATRTIRTQLSTDVGHA